MPKVYNKHHKNAPHDAVYVGRPTKWGNPWVIGVDGTRDDVIQKYRDSLSPEMKVMAMNELHGKDLVCFCAPRPCHADVLLEVANPTGTKV